MKILFIDHSFHEKTRSSHFFVSLLESHFTVDVVYVDPTDRDAMVDLAAVTSFDLVVLWQMDFLAPLVLARGVPTVVVPMFDGSSNMPDLHWLWARKARIVNFSRRLHDRVTHLGGRSHLVKYFLPPVREKERAHFDGLDVLLWQRRPEHGINLGLVERIFGSQLRSVHIHDAPDDPTLDTTPYIQPTLSGYELSVSRWFENRRGFDDLLRRHNTLIAPRRSEGIGMAMLEGFSRGMLVVAHDAPTHDEYISNWLNGVLFNADAAAPAKFGEAAALGASAWSTAVDGHAKWRASELELVDFVASTPKPGPVAGIDIPALGRSLVRAYMGGLDQYATFLLANETLIEGISEQSLVGRLDARGRFTLEAASPQRKRQARELPWLDQNRADASALTNMHLVVDGGVKKIEDAAWVVGHALTLGFLLDPQLGATRTFRLSYLLPPHTDAEVGYCISLNNTTLRISTVSNAEGVIECQIPPHVLKRDNYLQIRMGASSFAFGNSEPLSLGIKSLEFA